MIKICRLLRYLNKLTKSITITVILVFLLLGSQSETLASPSVTKKVLIISSYSSDFPFYASFTNGIKSRLADESTTEFQIFHESLDRLRFKLDDSFYEHLANVLREKHASNPPDIIITHGDFASNFVKLYGRNMFGTTPAILTAYEQEGSMYQMLPANCTLLVPMSNIASNIGLILEIKPVTKKIYIVFGASSTEKNIRAHATQELEAFAGRVEIIYLDQLPYPDMLDYISKIKGDAVILFRAFEQDVRGNSYIPAEVVKAIHAVALVPVFGSAETQLGIGAVGGYMNNTPVLARQAAEKALDALHGKEQDNQVQRLNIANLFFDFRELSRWGIDEKVLPMGSIIKYKSFSFLDSYKWYIVIGLCVVAIQSTLIALLVVNKRKRKRAEKELWLFDRLNLVGEMATGIAHEVRNPLTTVRGYLQLFQRKEMYAQHKEQFTAMIEELDMANSIITEFISLAKDKRVELIPGNLNDTIQALLPLLQSSVLHLGHNIITDKGDIPIFNYDDKEMRQLIVKLVENGLEAMPSKGVITIKTYATNDHLILEIRDTGTGIPSNLLEKLGTPFVTTKDSGTGLGLPICYRIAERHNAKIEVNTSPSGTKFFVAFRLSQ